MKRSFPSKNTIRGGVAINHSKKTCLEKNCIEESKFVLVDESKENLSVFAED